ncbi:MAG: PPOX class F420-dependent oxidoreductase [Anaerolineales bacterium]|nr:PPOX class F420-dependent oxidoreductase [Anaerolineales bacterium]MCB8951420.1 PPOX class F420-dependent oxidoreductase [Ardenticatenales bacterium]
MKKMTSADCMRFLRQGARTGKLATVRADGRPHVVPVWYDVDGEEIVFMTWHKSVKAANMRRDPRICLCVDEETPPFSFVQVEGEVVIDEAPADVRYWAARIGGKYMGADQAEAYGARNGVPGEWVVRLRPSRFVGFLDMTG